MSEGDLMEPINPNYQPPTVEITFEVERYVGDRWEKHRFDLNRTSTPSQEGAQRMRDYYEQAGFKARAIRVESIRTQL